MRIYTGPLTSKIETDNPKLLSALVNLFEVPIPGARYSPAARRGFCASKRKFISDEGEFRTGLLGRVLETLKKIDCYPEIKHEVMPTIWDTKSPTIDGWTMHDYQVEAVKKVLVLKRGVLKAPTGSGKTLILASLLKSFEGKKVLCLFNQKQLIHQTYKYLTAKAPDGVALPTQGKFKVGVCFSEGYEYADIMLCSVFSIERLIGTPMERPDVLIVDECHEFCKGKFTSEVISSFPTATYRIGLTATVPSDKYRLYNLEGALGPEISTVTTEELIEEGKLAKPLIQFIPMEPKFVNTKKMGYPEVYEKYIIKNNARNNVIKSIVESIYKNNTKAKVLILVKNLEHGETIKNLIPDSEYLQGSDDLSARDKTIKSFRTGDDNMTLIGTKILQTGANIPEITHLINARGLESEISTIQALGRALRITPEVTDVKIYDFIDSVRFLDRHSAKRLRTYKKEGHETKILPAVQYDNPR